MYVSDVSEDTRSRHVCSIKEASAQRVQAIVSELRSEVDGIREEVAVSAKLYSALCTVLGAGTLRRFCSMCGITLLAEL